jgi:small subunit ribosomal protein S17
MSDNENTEETTEEPTPEPEPEPEAETAEEPDAAAEPATEETVEEAPAAEETVSAAPGPKKQRSQKHVPRSARRQRPKRVRTGTGERKAIVRLEKPEHERGRRQERRGVVVSDVMDKTIVVKVEAVKAHQKYKKVIRRSVKFHAHDPENKAHIGDVVRIVETRPISKSKNWRLAEILEVAK